MNFCLNARDIVPQQASVDEFIHGYVIPESEKERCGLERNHTHFLLFDGDSTTNDSLLQQRAAIENYAREIDWDRSSENSLIPMIMVLVEGGPFSIRTICQALISNIPLVVLKVFSSSRIHRMK